MVDDEPALREALKRALRMEGYRVDLASDGREALGKLIESPPDAVVLDILMPGIDGLGVCRRLRALGDRTPVLMLTARDSVGDRVEGLDAGADDYLVKPFAVEELLARVRALLRRVDRDQGTRILRFADLSLDPATREVRRAETLLELSATEFALLEAFLIHPRQVLTRTALYDAVWGYDFGSTSKSLEVYVGYLRKKTEVDGRPRLIQTVRGIGYVLREG